MLARRFERCSRFERAGPGRGRLGRAAGSPGSAIVVEAVEKSPEVLIDVWRMPFETA